MNNSMNNNNNNNSNFNLNGDAINWLENSLFSYPTTIPNQQQLLGNNVYYQRLHNEGDLSFLDMLNVSSCIPDEDWYTCATSNFQNYFEEETFDFLKDEEKDHVDTLCACITSKHLTNINNEPCIIACTENNTENSSSVGDSQPINHQVLSNVIQLNGVRRLNNRHVPYRSTTPSLACNDLKSPEHEPHAIGNTIPTITIQEINNDCMSVTSKKESTNSSITEEQLQLSFFLNNSPMLISEENSVATLHKQLQDWLINGYSKISQDSKQKDFVQSIIEIKCNPQFEKCSNNNPTRLSVFVNNYISIQFPLPSDSTLSTYLTQEYKVELRTLLIKSDMELYNDNLNYTLLEQSSPLYEIRPNRKDSSILDIVVPIKRDNTTKLKKRKEAKQQLIASVPQEKQKEITKGERKVCFIQIVNSEGHVLGRSETFWVRSKTKSEMNNKKKFNKKRQYNYASSDFKSTTNETICSEGISFCSSSTSSSSIPVSETKRKREQNFENSNGKEKITKLESTTSKNIHFQESSSYDKLTILNTLMPGLVYQPSNAVVDFLLQIMALGTQNTLKNQ